MVRWIPFIYWCSRQRGIGIGRGLASLPERYYFALNSVASTMNLHDSFLLADGRSSFAKMLRKAHESTTPTTPQVSANLLKLADRVLGGRPVSRCVVFLTRTQETHNQSKKGSRLSSIAEVGMLISKHFLPQGSGRLERFTLQAWIEHML